MFDIAPSELLLVAVVALLVIGPKDLPLALRTAGRWMGKVRRMSNHFRAGVETMIREAELAEIEKDASSATRIMAEHPDAEALDAGVPAMEPLDKSDRPHSAWGEAATLNAGGATPEAEPELPLDGADGKCGD